jgi:hypothetical protein
MSDYGADAKPDINIAQKLVYTDGLINQNKSNVMQWTLPITGRVQKICNKRDKTNIKIKLDY